MSSDQLITHELQHSNLPDESRQALQAVLLKLIPALLAIPGQAVIGISGAQGSGKSTLAGLLAKLLTACGKPAAAVSLDDYYLNRTARQQLAKKIHPLLAQRGVPGTHNIQRAITDARNMLQGKPISLPRFDKAHDEPIADLPAQHYQILIVEGWCLAVTAQHESELTQAVNQYEQQQDTGGHWRHYVNQQLAGPYAEYWQLLQPLIWLQAPDWQAICRWRANQEASLKQQRGTSMNEAELARFMLSFQRLTEASWQQLPARANYIITLDQQQRPQLTKTPE